jgi:hypothetical protein
MTKRDLSRSMSPRTTSRDRTVVASGACLVGLRHQIELLAELAEAGLVRMQKQPVIGSYGTEMTRVHITEAGRQVLAG